MPNEKSTDGSPHNDALAALHGLRDQPAPADAPPPEQPGAADELYEVEEVAELAGDSEPGPSASGFVGMLSKNGAPQEEPVPAPRTNPSPQSARPTPQPSSQSQAAPSSPRAPGTDEIRMAREIVMPAAGGSMTPGRSGAAAGGRTGARGPRKVPGWYHIAVPIMFTLSSLLMVIGFWALGAVAYIFMAAPRFAEDVGYPLISWDVDIGESGGISAGSKLMAFVMLIALPVAICLIVMAIVMKRQVSRAAQAAARKG